MIIVNHLLRYFDIFHDVIFDFQNRFGIKLGFMSFFVKASIIGLKLFPVINAETEESEIVYKNYYNRQIKNS